VHRRGALQRRGRYLGKADAADLALFLETHQGPHHVLDGHVLVAAMDVEQLDMVAAETPQRTFERLAKIVRPVVEVPVRARDDARLGGHGEAVRATADELAHDLLGQAVAVDEGGVEMGDAEFVGLRQGGEALGPVGRAVYAAEAHAAERDRADRGAVPAEPSQLHQRPHYARPRLAIIAAAVGILPRKAR
jgi:hypothetical protein